MKVNNRQDPGFKEEEKNLQTLEGRISSIVNTIHSEIKKNQQKMITERDPLVKKQLDQENVQYKIDAQYYENRKPKPYFARLSFQADGKKETYLIGKKGLNDYEQKSDILVVDWRTPFAQAFTQKSRNKFEFDGESYILTLRRAVNIKNAKLISYNDEYSVNIPHKETSPTDAGDQVQNGSDREPEKPPAGITPINKTDSSNIVDPFLLELLQDQRRQNAVTDIIATIQEKQNDIICQPYNKNFIVQGCSGSGKTMILLHRLSYLIFNKLQEKIPLNNIRVITPNKDFSHFIDNLMHDLDLDHIAVMPVEELYVELIKRVTTGLETERVPVSDTYLPSTLSRNYYSFDFLSKITQKYNDYWQRILAEIRGNAFDDRYEKLCGGPEKFGYAGYQTLFEAHSRDSRVIERINREVEEARNRLSNAMAMVRADVLNRIEAIPADAKIILEEREKVLQERDNCEKRINNNLSKRDLMDTFLDYGKYRSEPGTAIAKEIRTHASEIIDKIRETEKDLASIPPYAFVQKYELNNKLQELKSIYTTKAREALDPYYRKFDEWQKTINDCNERIRDFDEQLDILDELDHSLKSLQEKIKAGKSPEDLREDPEYGKWEKFLSPYFEAKEGLREAELKRESNSEYIQYKKIGQLLDLLKQDAIYKDVYEAAFLSDIEGMRGDNEQFHFELFLKLHFCLRYFGSLSARMFINIDEGQVLYASEYKVLQVFLGNESILNIYGDINQKVDYSTGIGTWNEISDTWQIFVLNENYRNTKQVTEFCNQTFFSDLIPIGIEGPDVQQLDLEKAVQWIIKQHEQHPAERCAIIYDGSRKNKAALENLVKGRKEFLWKFSDKSGIFVLSADLSRGLEFENVVSFDKDMSIGGRYISYTRTLNQLIVVSDNGTDYETDSSNEQSIMETTDTNIDDSDNASGLNPDDLISQEDFVRKVNVQSETIERYIRDGLLVPDLVIKVDDKKTENYFREETLSAAAEKYKWTLIDDNNRKEQFMNMVKDMKMSASYKPVLLNGFFKYADKNGRAKLNNLVRFFRAYYEDRRARGMVVENPSSLFAKNKYSHKDIEKLILTMPYKRFEDRGMMHYDSKTGLVEMDLSVWENLTEEEKKDIPRLCDVALDQYYLRFVK